MDEDACWRWAFKKAYGRRPRGDELTRYKFWHGISRRDGFGASGPWECWPSKPLPPHAVVPEPSPPSARREMRRFSGRECRHRHRFDGRRR
jgi:hypothetical protein